MLETKDDLVAEEVNLIAGHDNGSSLIAPYPEGFGLAPSRAHRAGGLGATKDTAARSVR